jgi:hypothetical protein
MPLGILFGAYLGLGIATCPTQLLYTPVPLWLGQAFLSFVLALLDYLVFSWWSLPTLEATSFKSTPFIGLLQFLSPCGGVQELLAHWEMTLMGTFLTTGKSLLPVYFSAAAGWLKLSAPAERDQLFCKEPVFQDSLWWLLPLSF